jgi:hypothetical protein
MKKGQSTGYFAQQKPLRACDKAKYRQTEQVSTTAGDYRSILSQVLLDTSHMRYIYLDNLQEMKIQQGKEDPFVKSLRFFAFDNEHRNEKGVLFRTHR